MHHRHYCLFYLHWESRTSFYVAFLKHQGIVNCFRHPKAALSSSKKLSTITGKSSIKSLRSLRQLTLWILVSEWGLIFKLKKSLDRESEPLHKLIAYEANSIRLIDVNWIFKYFSSDQLTHNARRIIANARENFSTKLCLARLRFQHFMNTSPFVNTY